MSNFFCLSFNVFFKIIHCRAIFLSLCLECDFFKDEKGGDSLAVQLADEKHWDDLVIVIAVVSLPFISVFCHLNKLVVLGQWALFHFTETCVLFIPLPSICRIIKRKKVKKNLEARKGTALLHAIMLSDPFVLLDGDVVLKCLMVLLYPTVSVIPILFLLIPGKFTAEGNKQHHWNA